MRAAVCWWHGLIVLRQWRWNSLQCGKGRPEKWLLRRRTQPGSSRLPALHHLPHPLHWYLIKFSLLNFSYQIKRRSPQHDPVEHACFGVFFLFLVRLGESELQGSNPSQHMASFSGSQPQVDPHLLTAVCARVRICRRNCLQQVSSHLGFHSRCWFNLYLFRYCLLWFQNDGDQPPPLLHTRIYGFCGSNDIGGLLSQHWDVQLSQTAARWVT